MSLAMQSPCEVSGAAFIPGEAVYLRLEGIAPSVAYRRDQLAKLLGRPDPGPGGEELRRQMAGDPRRHAVRRPAVAPGLAPVGHTVGSAPASPARCRTGSTSASLYDWAGGLVWIELPPAPDASAPLVRGAFSRAMPR
jgi:glycolate oxidase FAD binding subunit